MVAISVQATIFDESGLGQDTKTWTRKYGYSGGESLDEFLHEQADLPKDEAADLAAKALGPWLEEWRRGGGEEETRAFNRFFLLFAGGAVIVLGLAFLGFALIVLRVAESIG
jgi:hypothetical protein